MTTHEQNLAEARQLTARIRKQLLDIEDVLTHAATIRGSAYLDSLQQALNHSESAVIHAVQTAVPVRSR
jgi:hypothetical protein